MVRAAGERPFSQEERNAVEFFHERLAELDERTAGLGNEPRLNPRERDVLHQVLQGASEKQVAAELADGAGGQELPPRLRPDLALRAAGEVARTRLARRRSRPRIRSVAGPGGRGPFLAGVALPGLEPGRGVSRSGF